MKYWCYDETASRNKQKYFVIYHSLYRCSTFKNIAMRLKSRMNTNYIEIYTDKRWHDAHLTYMHDGQWNSSTFKTAHPF